MPCKRKNGSGVKERAKHKAKHKAKNNSSMDTGTLNQEQ